MSGCHLPGDLNPDIEERPSLVRNGIPNRPPRRGPLLRRSFSDDRPATDRAIKECESLIEFLRDLRCDAISNRSISSQRLALPLISRLHELLSFLMVRNELGRLGEPFG